MVKHQQFQQKAMTHENAQPPAQPQPIGVVATAARVAVGLILVGSVMYGEFSSQPKPIAWVLGLVAFPALMVIWHAWRVHRHPAPFRDMSIVSFVLSVAIPAALYFTWWYAPAIGVISDATLLFVGGSMLLAAGRRYAGCELLAVSNWLLRRHDQIACAIFTPLDYFEQRRRLA